MTDLRALDKAATQGEWTGQRVCRFNSAYGGYVHFLNDQNCDDSSSTCRNRITATANNAAFIVALVNAYRAGTLVERTTPPTDDAVREAMDKIHSRIGYDEDESVYACCVVEAALTQAAADNATLTEQVKRLVNERGMAEKWAAGLAVENVELRNVMSDAYNLSSENGLRASSMTDHPTPEHVREESDLMYSCGKHDRCTSRDMAVCEWCQAPTIPDATEVNDDE